MSEQTITVTLPDSIYERITSTAQTTSLTSEEVIRQSVILLFPALETDIPPDVRLSLTKLSLLNDIQLWQTAHSTMDEQQQVRLEELATSQKNHKLTDKELSELYNLMNDAQQVLLCKAEARRLLAQRGHVVFNTVEH